MDGYSGLLFVVAGCLFTVSCSLFVTSRCTCGPLRDSESE
jgi:hypothetical protein